MHSHCASCLRHAFPSLRCALHIFAVPLPFFAWPCSAYPIYAMPLLIGATPCDSLALPSKPRQSFAKMFQAMQCLCGSARFTARPCLSVHGSALLFLCHSTPRLCFSSLCLASHFLCFSFSPLRLALPLLFYATLLPAYQFLCRSIHCDDVPLLINSIPSCANPLQINSWLCAAFALLSCALPCHPLLCPCAADQETSAQRKRPLPELRH